jgi:hypothetical protein
MKKAEILSLLDLMPAGADAEMMRSLLQVAAFLPQADQGESPHDGAPDRSPGGLEDAGVEVQTRADHSLCPPASGGEAGPLAADDKAFLVFLRKLPDKQTPLPVRREILSCLRQRPRADPAVVSLLRKILNDPGDPLRPDVLRSLPQWPELNTAATLQKMIKE